MKTAQLIATIVLFTTLSAAMAEDAPRAVDRVPADVSLIAAWLTGSDDAKAFGRPFGDREFITRAKDAIFYSDIQGVTVPRQLRRVPYDFVKPRMERIRGGHKADPAVIITRSIAEEPEEGGTVKREIRVPKPGARYYYVEVAIGNLAWHWMKLAVYEVDGRSKVEFLWSAIS